MLFQLHFAVPVLLGFWVGLHTRLLQQQSLLVKVIRVRKKVHMSLQMNKNRHNGTGGCRPPVDAAVSSWMLSRAPCRSRTRCDLLNAESWLALSGVALLRAVLPEVVSGALLD